MLRPLITNYDWSTGALLQLAGTGKEKIKIKGYLSYNLSLGNNFPNKEKEQRNSPGGD